MLFKDSQLNILLIDTIAYFITFIYFYIKMKGLTIGNIILLMFCISHLCGIPYYYVYKDIGNLIDIKPIAYVFLYTMTILTIYPLLQFRGFVNVRMTGNRVFYYFTVFLFVISIIPFFENLLYFVRQGGVYSNYGELYQMKREGVAGIHIYSKIGTQLMWVSGMFKIVSLGLLFYYIRFYTKYKSIVWMLVFIQLNFFLNGLNLGSRGSVVSSFLMYLICFILLKRFYPNNIRKNLLKCFIAISIPTFLVLSIMTISRYNGMKTSLSTTGWVVGYLGEGPVNFSTLMWDGKHNTKGDVNLNYFKSVLGLKTYKSYDERDEHYYNLNGRRIEIFYTYIGDFLSDFGYAGTVIVCIILFLFAKSRLSKRNKVISFEDYIVIIIFLNLYVLGFASNLYRSYNMQMNVVVTIIFLLSLRLLSSASTIYPTNNYIRR